MMIETVTLENIRSHKESTLTFSKGFNCLVGGLGSGKSSVLYAVDFAFFGDPLGRSYNYLLREDCDKGSVTVRFLQNGRSYTIMRGLKRRRKNISQDSEKLRLYEGKKLIASVKNDAVSEQLNSITGLNEEIFREIIWVQQERLKELLNIRPRERQKKLDQLFGLSDYESAWSTLSGLQKDYTVEKRVCENDYDVLGFSELQADYHEAVESFATIENDLQKTRKSVVDTEILLNQADSKLASLEEMRKKTEELRREEAHFKANVENTFREHDKLSKKIEEQEHVIQGLERELKDLEEQVKTRREGLVEIGLASKQTFEEIGEALSTVERQIANTNVERETVTWQLQNSRERVSNLKAENQCPTCLQPISEKYRSKLVKSIEKEERKNMKKLEELQKTLEESENKREPLNAAYAALQNMTPQIELYTSRIVNERSSLESLVADSRFKQRELEALRKKLDETRLSVRSFDGSELEKTRRQRDNLLGRYSTLKSKLENLETRKKDAGEKINEYGRRLQRAEEKQAKLKKLTRLLDVVDAIRNAYRSIQPQLRTEFVKILQHVVQRFLDDLFGAENQAFTLKIDENYTPSIQSLEDREREVSNLSGGERTLVAFSYRLALGQLIMQSKTGHGLQMLVLDEPTESLGREDSSIDRLADAVSNLKTIEQIIAVTHNEVFAEKAEHVVRLVKEAGVSQVHMGEDHNLG